ncbi:MAG: orotidine-5'-phosphate decarboxylase [Candidatus Omnitrophota bacterium]
MREKNRLIVALDGDNYEQAEKLIDTLSPEVDIFKVGAAPFTAYGHEVLKKINEAGKKVFLDLKVHDIPNTVANAARAAAEKRVFMMNFHCLGGGRMLEAAARGAKEGSEISGGKPPILLGVTVLTSMSDEDMREIGLAGRVQDKVLELARLAKDSGLDGVVASAQEAHLIKEKIGKDFIVVTPGVRPEWAQAGDQKRIVTPKQAIEGGADYIVVGRPIIKDDDPLGAAKKIIKEMERP